MRASSDYGNHWNAVFNCKTRVPGATGELYPVPLAKWAHGVDFAARIIENLVTSFEQLLGVVGMRPDRTERNEKLIEKRIVC